MLTDLFSFYGIGARTSKRYFPIPIYTVNSYGAVILATVVGVVSSSWVKMLGMGNFVTLIFSAVLFFGGYGVILTVLKEPLVWEIESQVLKKLTKKK